MSSENFKDYIRCAKYGPAGASRGLVRLVTGSASAVGPVAAWGSVSCSARIVNVKLQPKSKVHPGLSRRRAAVARPVSRFPSCFARPWVCPAGGRRWSRGARPRSPACATGQRARSSKCELRPEREPPGVLGWPPASANRVVGTLSISDGIVWGFRFCWWVFGVWLRWG